MLRMKKYILISLVAIWAAMPLMAQTSTFAVGVRGGRDDVAFRSCYCR